MGDWDGDGDYDMVLGHISGPVKYFENTGGLQFADRGALMLNGKALDANDGGPCIVDWTGDGKLDLILGDGEGAVKLFETKSKGSKNLVPGVPAQLIPGLSENAGWEPRKRDPKTSSGLSPNRPGVRTKPYAADWNSDGKLDLLVGDYIQVSTPKMALTAKQKLELAAAKKESQQVMTKLQNRYTAVQAKALKAVGAKSFENMTKKQGEQFNEEYSKAMQADEEYKKLSARYSVLAKTVGSMEGQPESGGFVWVYLRK